MKEKVDGGEDENDSLKAKKKKHLEEIKEKLGEVQNLKEQKNEDKKKRVEYERKIKSVEGDIDELDNALSEVMREERQIHLRILKLCEFLIKYCKISQNGKIRYLFKKLLEFLTQS